MDNLEEQLTQMSKPEVSQLKHQDLLAGLIMQAKSRSVVSWWWLAVPIYIAATLFMKTFFMPESSFAANLRDRNGQEQYTSLFFFLVLPLALIWVNLTSVRRIHIALGNPDLKGTLRAAWSNILLILAALLVITIYAI